MTDAKLWLVIVAMCGAGWLICQRFNHRDRARAASRELDEAVTAVVLARYELELDHHEIDVICREHGLRRWTR